MHRGRGDVNDVGVEYRHRLAGEHDGERHTRRRDAVRPGRRATAGRALSARSVMPTSLPPFLCWYQEPGYPGTNTTWQAKHRHGRMANVSVTTVEGGTQHTGTDHDRAR